MNNKSFLRSVQTDSISLIEKNAIAIAISNSIFPRLDAKSKIMLMSYIRTAWKHVKLPLRHQLAITDNKSVQSLPMILENETPIQIEDKRVMSDVNDAVAVSTVKLKLASSVLFQSKCVSLIENLSTFRNVS